MSAGQAAIVAVVAKSKRPSDIKVQQQPTPKATSHKSEARRDAQYKDWVSLSKKAAMGILEFSESTDSKKDGFVPVLHALLASIQALEIMIMNDPQKHMAALLHDLDVSMMATYDSRDLDGFHALAKQRDLAHDVVVHNSFDNNESQTGDESYYHTYEPFGSENRHGLASLLRLLNAPDSNRFTSPVDSCRVSQHDAKAKPVCPPPEQTAPSTESWKEAVELILSQQHGAENYTHRIFQHDASLPLPMLNAVHTLSMIEAKCAVAFMMSSQMDSKTIDAVRLSHLRCEYIFSIISLLRHHRTGLCYHRAFTEVNGTLITLLYWMLARIVPSGDEFSHIIPPDLCAWMLQNLSLVPCTWANFVTYPNPHLDRRKIADVSMSLVMPLFMTDTLDDLIVAARSEYETTIKSTSDVLTAALSENATVPSRAAETMRVIDRYVSTGRWSRNGWCYDVLDRMSDGAFRRHVHRYLPTSTSTKGMLFKQMLCLLETAATTTERAILAVIPSTLDEVRQLACIQTLLSTIAGLVSDWEHDRMPATLSHTKQAHQDSKTQLQHQKDYDVEVSHLKRHIQKHYASSIARICSMVRPYRLDSIEVMISLLQVSEHVNKASITINTVGANTVSLLQNKKKDH